MAISIGELFVSLRIKGSDQATKALGNIKSGMADISTNGLAAKAAVLGVVYAVERMTAGAAQIGTNYKRFMDYMGTSSQRLQQFESAFRSVNGPVDQVAGTVEAMTDNLNKVKLGVAAPPAGYKFIDVRNAKDGFDVLQGMLNLIRSGTRTRPQLNIIGESLGISRDMMSSLYAMKGDFKDFGATLSDGTIKQLDHVNSALQALKKTLSDFGSKNVAIFGLPVISELRSAIKLFVALESVLVRFAGKIPHIADIIKTAFLAISGAMIVFGGPLTAIAGLVNGVILLMGEWEKHKDKKDNLFDNVLKSDTLSKLLSGGAAAFDTVGTMSSPKQTTINNTHSTEINQNINGVDHKDRHSVSKNHKDGAQAAYAAFSTNFQLT